MLRRLARWVLDPHKLVAGFAAAAGTGVLLVLPPVANVQIREAEGRLVSATSAAVAFVVAALLSPTRRTLAMVVTICVAVVVIVTTVATGGYYAITTNQARGLHRDAHGWTQTVDDTYSARTHSSTRGTDRNGSGSASTINGVLTIRLRSTHVANQQYFVREAAPAGSNYFVETQVRRQYGPLNSGCFLAFSVIDSDRYYLYTVTDDARGGLRAHSALVAQEVRASPAIEKPVAHSDALPYVDNWSVLPRLGAEASWTTLAVYKDEGDYVFFVNDRKVAEVSDVVNDTGRVTVGAYDPGTSDGSYVGCQFRYLHAWQN
jgi:hypothetical protein